MVGLLFLLGCQLPQPLQSLSPAATAPPQTVLAPATENRPVLPTPTVAPFDPILPSPPDAGLMQSLAPPSQSANTIQYQRDLAQVVNPQHLPLLVEAERVALLTEGKVLLAPEQPSVADFVTQIAAQESPFLLSQSVVRAYQQTAVAESWRGVATDFVEPMMLALAERVVIASAEQWQLAANQGWFTRQQAAERNWVYFTVVGRILDPAFPTSDVVAPQVNDELDLLALGGLFQSPYQGHAVDYALFLREGDPLGKGLLWYQHIPLAEAESEQFDLLQAALAQDEETAVLWERLFLLLGGEAWWASEAGTPIHIFSNRFPYLSHEPDAVFATSEPVTSPILIEPSDWYQAAAADTRQQINRLASAGLLDETVTDRLLKLEQTLAQLALLSAQQTVGYSLSVAEKEWLATVTAEMVNRLPSEGVAGQMVVLLTLYEGEQTVFVGVELP